MTFRRILGGAVALLPLAGFVVTAIIIVPTIGPRMASHWSGGSTPNGFSDTVVSLWIFAAATAIITAVAIAFIVRRSTGTAARTGAGIATLTGAIAAGAWIISAFATAQAPSPERAVIGLNWLVLLAAPVLGAAVALLIPSNPRPDADARSVAPLPLAASGRVAWSGVTGSTPFVLIGLVIAVAGLIGGIVIAVINVSPSALIVAAVVVVAGLSSLLLGRVRLTVDQRGVRLVSILFGVPLMRIPLASIASVQAETIDPLSWGGWGYRISSGRRAYVTRRSAGLVVTNRAGFASAVTIEDAATAASVVQTLLERTPAR
jgi:hypothetical protein